MDDGKKFVKIENKVEKVDFTFCESENYQYQNIANILSVQNENQVLPIKYTPKKKKVDLSKDRAKLIKYFKCHRCEKICLTKKKMIDHFKDHDLEIHKCSQCERGFTSKNSLSYHVKSHAGIKHECDICNRKFNDKSNMKKHRNIHLNIKNYKCTSCPKTFSDPSCLKHHQERHAGIRFKCDFCDKSYAARPSLKAHIKLLHLKMKCFKCNSCSSSFNYEQQLTEHENKYHLDRKYECDICQATFYLKHKLKEHLVTHPSMHLKCTLCGERFDRIWRYLDHERRHSTHLKCPHCPKQIRDRQGLTEHVYRCHIPKTCPVCGKTFRLGSVLRKHMTSHSQDIFECDICGIKYQKKESIMNHMRAKHLQTELFACESCDHTSYDVAKMRTHENNHPILNYWCKYCTVKFRNQETFKAHLDEHFGEKLSSNERNWKEHVRKFVQKNRYKCDICKLRYRLLKNLKIHIDSDHMGIKYRCTVCAKEYSRESSLYAHRKTHEDIQFECSQCNKRYVRMSSLRKHLKSKRKCYLTGC